MNQIKFTIRAKIITSFIVIIAVILLISTVSYFTLRSFITEQNDMIHKTVLANEISLLVGEIPDAESRYILDQTAENKQVITDSFTTIQENIALIEANLATEETIKGFDSAHRMLESFSENNDKYFSYSDSADMVTQQKLMKRYARLVQTGIEDYLSVELAQQDIERVELFKKTQTTGYTILAILLIVGALSVAFAIYLSSQIGNSLKHLIKYAGNIAKGDLRTQTFEVKSKDEVSVLADSFHDMTEHLSSVIGKIVHTSTDLYDSATMIKQRAEESTIAIDQIATNTQDAVEGAQNQVDEAEKTEHAVTELISLNTNINNKSDTVLQSARESINVAATGNEKAKSMISQMESIKEKVNGIQYTIDNLKDNSSQIQQIVDTINSISQSTNLLALNAAIEAARVGEHGKGFAVVADEIRKLANNSATSTQEISGILNKIQLDVNELTDGMDKVVEDVDDGSQKASEVDLSFNDIVSSNNNVESEIQDITTELNNMADEIRKIENISKGICDISESSLDSSTDISAVVEEQLATQEDFFASAQSLTEMASELKGIVSEFEV